VKLGGVGLLIGMGQNEMSWGWLWSGMGVCIQARARRGGVAFGFDCAKQMIKMQTKKINRENTSDGTVQDSYCERMEGGGY